MSQSCKRILLGHLASNGDCLLATTIARQIKADFPGCHLTWAISSRCRSMIEGNPDVDVVWQVPTGGVATILDDWRAFEYEAALAKECGDFDEVFLTQISPTTFHLWAGSVRSSIHRAYPRPITVDDTPVLRLSSEERERVLAFAEKHHLKEKKHVLLFECGPQSQQSLVTPQFALEIAARLVEGRTDATIILSSHHTFDSTNPAIVDASVLSLRENAELTNYCTLLVGASSGITWIATSDAAKQIPTLQLVVPDVTRSNSLFYDFQKRGKDTAHILEMHSYSADDVNRCLCEILDQGFSPAKTKFQQTTPFKLTHYRNIQHYLVATLQLGKAVSFLKLNIQEYGYRPRFVSILLSQIVRKIALIPAKMFFVLQSRTSR